MKIVLLAVSFLLLIACRQTAPQQNWENTKDLALPAATYAKADLQKMGWLVGVWQATDAQAMQENIRMLNDSTLEIKRYIGPSMETALQLQWKAGRYYLGEDWVVSWIGRKTIRLEPLREGVPALTWTRRSDNGWFAIRHESTDTKQVFMQRAQQLGEVHYP